MEAEFLGCMRPIPDEPLSHLSRRYLRITLVEATPIRAGELSFNLMSLLSTDSDMQQSEP